MQSGVNSKYLKITLLLVSSLTIMAGATIAASLPEMAELFKDVEHIELLAKLVLTLPSLFMALLSPFVGMNINRFGRKRLLVIGMLLYGFGGTSGFFLNDIHLILISRALLGISIAINMTVASTLIGDYFKGEERHKYTGLQTAFVNIGGIVFITFGGFLAEISWRMPFLIYLAPFFILPLVIKYIYEPQFHPDELNVSFSYKQVYHVFFYSFIGVIFFYMVPTQIPFLLHVEFGIKGAETGAAIAMMMISSTIMSLQYKRIKQHLSYHKVYIIVTLGFGIGFLLVYCASTMSEVFIALGVVGLGTGMMMVNTMNYLLHIAPIKARGSVVGINSSIMSIAMFLSPVVVAPILHYFSLKETFGVCGLLLLVCSLWFILTKKDD
ncbi:MAG: MFS transporter [Campylobacterales bacterium]|nr:MFS transporter [Campylobacterales bacterium]